MTDPTLALFPGSFDPPTNGHLDIIRRCAALYDKVYVVVANNVAKHSLFSAEERKDMLERLTGNMPNVTVDIFSGLIVNYAKANHIGVMIRGVRANAEFNYELELALYNKQLDDELEVLFMPTSPKYFMLRSSAIREMAAFGADVSGQVPALVAEALKRRVTPRS